MMKRGKIVGLDEISIEVWKCLGDVGLCLLTNLCNQILSVNKMPSKWSRSTLIPISKNKGDIQWCTNFCGIKLLRHYETLERVIEHSLRHETTISDNQSGFMLGQSTMEKI